MRRPAAWRGMESSEEVSGGGRRARCGQTYQKGMRKGNGKEDAIYGVFGDDSEDEGFGGRPKRPEKRSDWTKCVSPRSV